MTKDADADRFDKLRVNYYGETAVAGSQIRFISAASCAAEHLIRWI